MDQADVYSQVRHPNGFHSHVLLDEAPSGFATERGGANGDWIASLCAADLRRLIAMTMLPFWDIGEPAAEMKWPMR